MGRAPGRPPFVPTAKDREQVKSLSGMGLDNEQIAIVIGISEPTLRKHFRKELDAGYIVANAAVAQSLYKQATDPKKPNVVAGIFWMKTRAGWIEAKDPAAIEQGKKAEKERAAKKAAGGRFKPSAPPKLVVNNKGGK